MLARAHAHPCARRTALTGRVEAALAPLSPDRGVIIRQLPEEAIIIRIATGRHTGAD